MALHNLPLIIGTVFAAALIYFLITGYKQRAKINDLRKQGVPMPKWNWLTGHLLVFKKYLDDLPPDVNPFYIYRELVEKDYADTEIFLLDVWPMFDPLLSICGPELAWQVSNDYDLQRPEEHDKYFTPTVGGKSLITMRNEEWKMWRSLFNPGFSAANMLALLPSMVDSVQVFCDILSEKAGKEMFSLDELATRLTMDIITKTTLNTDLDNQREEHALSYALKTIVAWDSWWDPRIVLHPLRPFIQRYYSRVMDQFVRKELAKRFEEASEDSSSSKLAGPGNKSVISLAIEGYLKIERQKQGSKYVKPRQLEEGFLRLAANNIRLFIFAGNDSTSSSIAFTIHLLQKHPETLAKLRQEHDTIFGPLSERSAAEQLKETPAMLNRCRYTMAVIKETLRVYPPAGALREGRPGISLTDRQGNSYAIEGLQTLTMHLWIQRNPRIWPRPQEFLPERWLAEPGDELYVPTNTGAYRPFEQGSRNCIGQTMVYNELSIVLIMTARLFDFAPAYQEWDAKMRENEGFLMKAARSIGIVGEKVNTVMGDRAYQTARAGGHPSDGYPCRVSIAK